MASKEGPAAPTRRPESSRLVVDLGGAWECCPVPDDLDQVPADADWRSIRVPANWHLAGLPNYAGTVFYRRRFANPCLEHPPGCSHRALLRFNGVDYLTEIWLNGAHLGSHEGYFAPFDLEATGRLHEDNELLVRVSAPKEAPGAWPSRKRLIKGIFQHHDCRPGGWDPEYGQDQGSGGIWNRVELLLLPSVYVAAVRVDARPPDQPAGPARLTVQVEIDAAEAGPTRLRLAARGLTFDDEPRVLVEQTLSLAPGRQEHRLSLALPEPRLWWSWDQGEPHRYSLRAELGRPPSPATDAGATGVDALEVEFGVRELRIASDTTWWLNGRRVFPRGTNIIPTQWLSTYDAAAIERDVRLLREAHVNAVRVHAHVNRDELYAACDRAGIMVWQDFALQWSYEESETFQAEACRQIGEMARHLYSHPSIVVWCCHNEPSFNRDTLDPELSAALRAVDASRQVEEASDFHSHPYPGWYWSGVDEFRACPGGPFVSEFGAQALPERAALEGMLPSGDLWPPNWPAWAYHDFQYDQTVNVAGLEPGTDLDDFIRRSQAYQARLLRIAVESYRRAKYRPISGLFQFMFVDCWDAITWSVLDFQRRPKQGYFALRRAYQPLLPSIDLRREHAVPGGDLQAGFWLVNDYPHDFADLTLRFGLRDVSGRVWWETARPVERLDADSVLAVHSIQASGFSPWRVPREAPAGDYLVFSELYDAAGALLAANEHPFEVRPLPAGLELPSFET